MDMQKQKHSEGAQPPSVDPWNELLHSQNVEIVNLTDLQKVHQKDALLNDADVEQALQIMQEQPPEEWNNAISFSLHLIQLFENKYT